MKIAYISYPAFADCDFPLIRALREQGNEVLYFLILSPFHCHSTLIDISCLKATYDIIPGDSYPELEQYNSYLNASSINIVNFGGNSKWGRLRLWFKLHHALRTARPDAIQLTHFFPPYAIFYYLTFRNKLFITIHDPVHHTGEYSKRDVLLRRIGTSAMRGFVFLSRNDTLINVFKERYHIPQRKIHYAALAPYDVLSAIPRDPAKHPCDFLFIGRISQYKGIDTLLEAMTLLSGTRPKAKLIVAGAGDFWFDISRYKNNPCIEIIHRFITPGELVAFIKDTRYVICPYTDGTQSGVIMSALAFGRPVIASNVGNFASIIKNGINGILVPPSNPAALAEAMDSALDPSKDSIIQENMSGTDFSQEWDMIARMYINAYRSSYHDHPKANSLPAKMRIAQMHRNLGTGGIEAMICGLSNELAKENDVTVCTIVQPSPEDKFYKELAPGIRRETIGRTGEGKPFKEMIRIARFVKEGHFDIVHIHGFFYYFALAILLHHRKTCFCYTVHSNALKENNPWDLRILPFKRFCFKQGWLHPITISPTSQDSFTQLYGCESRLIPNGVVLPEPKEGSNLDTLRMTPDTRVFLHASRICPEKNQVMLCKVFDRLIREGKDVALAVAGPIHHHEIFDEMSPLFSERIQYIGERSDIPALLCTADGMCLTSFYEGLPVILLESLAAGCIPVCTPVGGILDVVRHGEDGILSKDVSEESYYTALRDFLALSEDTLKQMKAACLRTSRAYDIRTTGRKYQDYYSELLSAR